MSKKSALAVFMLLALPSISSAEISSRAECILTYMPGVMNDRIANMVKDHCGDTYYGRKFDATPRKPGEGGMQNAIDCAIQKGAATTSNEAAETIRDACNDLYPKQQSSLVE